MNCVDFAKTWCDSSKTIKLMLSKKLGYYLFIKEIETYVVNINTHFDFIIYSISYFFKDDIIK